MPLLQQQLERQLHKILHLLNHDDFRTLAFNALPDEADNNPTIEMNVGDTVVFNVDNGGISFHSFGVTKDD